MNRMSSGLVIAVLVLPLGCATNRAIADTMVCRADSALDAEAIAAPFHAYRSGTQGFDLRWRDIEFLLDSLYTDGITPQVGKTLDRFAGSLVDSVGWNPFGIQVSEFNLIYDYFRREGGFYTQNPFDTTSVVLGTLEASTYKPSDRSHSDIYIWNPTRNVTVGGSLIGGSYPSPLISGEEDLSTFHSTEDVKPRNSIGIKGPVAAQMIDTTGAGWTHPESFWSFGFDHEFQHSLPEQSGFTEMFSAGAEAIGGSRFVNTVDDIPYTSSLIGTQRVCLGGCGSCGPVRLMDIGYNARTAFMAYVGYNFLGADDASATLAAAEDDLLRRWRRNVNTFAGLRGLLTNDSCVTCAEKDYFSPNGTALDTTSRLALLHHNFRVANYVNNSDLDEGQYGYPPAYRFSPAGNLGAWQSLDACGDENDVIVIPSELVLTDRFLSRDTTLAGTRAYAGIEYPLVLQPYGSEYWVLRSDESLWNEGQDLVVRVSADGLGRETIKRISCSSGVPADEYDGRIVASVIAYSEQDSAGEPQDLWAHPWWAARAVAPRWSDVDSLAGDLEFVVPAFGDSFKAALVVITLADGPRQRFLGESLNLYIELLKYRLHVGIRTSPELASNPYPFMANGSDFEDQASWSPTSDKLAYVRKPSGVTQRVYTATMGSGGNSLYSAYPFDGEQSYPDWSPRGDKIVFSQRWGGGGVPYECLAAYDFASDTTTVLKYGYADANWFGVFQPNGQGIAYVAEQMDESSQTEGWQVRYMNVDGSGDTALVSRGANGNFKSPRWTPDGQWVYFTANDSLYAVRAAGNPFGQVVARVALADSVVTFDLPTSGSGVLIEETRTLRYPYICDDFSVEPYVVDTTLLAGQDVHRVAVRDTSRQLTDPRFYKTGGTFTQPRFSRDGTKIVYTTDQQAAGSAKDLYVGSVSWNHAPAFDTEPADVVVDTCSVVSIDFSATDPDGEGVTYAGAYLPENSSISSDGVFTWNPPTSGDTYVVLRALDGSGGVAQKVVKISVPDEVRPDSVEITGVFATSNSVALEWVASGDDSLTGTACAYVVKRHSQAITEANWSVATHVVQSISPQESGGYEFLQINGLSPNTDYWFAIKVHDEAGDHLSKLSNVVHAKTTSGGGGLGESARQVAGGDTHARGTSASRGVSASNVAPNRTVAPTTLVGNANPIAVEMTRSEGALTWQVYRLDETEAEALGASGAQLLIQRPDGEDWSTRSSYALGLSNALVGLRPTPGDHTRAVLLGDLDLVSAETAAGRGSGASGALLLSSADHSRLGDFMESLAPDSGAMDVAVGDTLTLTYEPTEETVTDSGWFLLFKNNGQAVHSTRRLPQTTPQLPLAFALAQNLPNPFASRTTIHFDLPQPAPVRLEIFDAQGRRVAQLADGWYPAGFHSVDWDRRGESGVRMRPGIYVYRIQAGPFRDHKKLVLLP